MNILSYAMLVLYLKKRHKTVTQDKDNNIFQNNIIGCLLSNNVLNDFMHLFCFRIPL